MATSSPARRGEVSIRNSGFWRRGPGLPCGELRCGDAGFPCQPCGPRPKTPRTAWSPQQQRHWSAGLVFRRFDNERGPGDSSSGPLQPCASASRKICVVAFCLKILILL